MIRTKKLVVKLLTASKNGRNLKNGFVETIKERILSGELKPGDRMPPERELAVELGISRGSVNQGILDLERMGFITVVPRKGAFVRDYKSNGTPDTLSAIMSYDSASFSADLFKDFMDMRILIERECVRLACKKIDIRSRQLLDERLENIYSFDMDRLFEAIYEFHLCIIGISGNAAYSMIFRSFSKMLKNMIKTHYNDGAELKRCLPMYSRLAAAISRGDTEEADRYITGILSSASDYLNSALDIREGSDVERAQL